MGSGETVLITAAAGGVGNWCVQLAKLAGNHVIGTCSTQEKAQELKRPWLRPSGGVFRGGIG